MAVSFKKFAVAAAAVSVLAVGMIGCAGGMPQAPGGNLGADRAAAMVADQVMRTLDAQIDALVDASTVPDEHKPAVKQTLKDVVRGELVLPEVQKASEGGGQPDPQAIVTKVSAELEGVLRRVAADFLPSPEQLRTMILDQVMSTLQPRIAEVVANAPVAEGRKPEIEAELTQVVRRNVSSVLEGGDVGSMPTPVQVAQRIIDELDALIHEILDKIEEQLE